MVAYDKTPGWFNSNDFYFNKIIESNYDAIKKECDYLVENNLLVPHIQSEENTETDTSKIQFIANKWNVFDLGSRGQFQTLAKELVPFTCNLLKTFPEITSCERGKVYFSMIPGNATVTPHLSSLKHYERYRHQLCLQSVEGADAYIEVNGEKRTWTQGKIISFDDAYIHHVKNNSEHTRIVLIYDTTDIRK